MNFLRFIIKYTLRISSDESGRFSLTQFLGLGKKSPDIKPITTPLPPKTIGVTPIGQDVTSLIRQAMQQGFGPGFVSATTSPVAEQLRTTLRRETIPGIESAASARGLGRSTIVGRDIGEATAQTGRDINQVIANAIIQKINIQIFTNITMAVIIKT